jgi:hypothetical protein
VQLRQWIDALLHKVNKPSEGWGSERFFCWTGTPSGNTANAALAAGQCTDCFSPSLIFFVYSLIFFLRFEFVALLSSGSSSYSVLKLWLMFAWARILDVKHFIKAPCSLCVIASVIAIPFCSRKVWFLGHVLYRQELNCSHSLES